MFVRCKLYVQVTLPFEAELRSTESQNRVHE